MREMTRPIYLVCGVPGSGKTWVCEQLKDKFTYIPHDKFYNQHASQIIKENKEAKKPIITECPFGERPLREELERAGLKVIPYFVIDDPKTITERYHKREGRPIPKNFVTRASSIKSRAKEWLAPSGTSSEILEMLREL